MQGFPQGSFDPAQPPRPPQPPRLPPQRGPLLTFLLLGITSMSAWTIMTAFLVWSVLERVAARQVNPTMSVPHAKKILLVMLLSGVVQLASAVGMWMWKQWGVFACVSMAFLQMFLWSHVTANHSFSYRPIVVAGFVLVAAASRWSDFER
ncbi:MAG: hypothetical protein JWP97_5524 [Labilithrix sp.]|nr:hypothetical protein [Labilithrix sp.]